MRVLTLPDLPTHDITRFGSEGFGIARVAPEAHVALATLAAGGRIGRHPAGVDQLLVVISGDAEVSGDDDVAHGIRPGSAALWAVGENHLTRTRHGLTALIVEADGLSALTDPASAQ